MDGLNEHHTRIVAHCEEGGQEDVHFTFYSIAEKVLYSPFLFFIFPSQFAFLISLLSFLVTYTTFAINNVIVMNGI